MGVAEAIHAANVLLPGIPTEVGQDLRWQAIIKVGDYIESQPEAVWEFIRQWGSHSQEDLRDAIATCLLEHLLQYHFTEYFPLIERLALDDPLFGDTFQRCWQFGQALEPGNSQRFVALGERLEAAQHS